MDKKKLEESSEKEASELKSIGEAVEAEDDYEKQIPENVDIYSTVVIGARDAVSFLKSLKLELIFLIYVAAYIQRSSTSVTMMMDRSCRVHLGYSDEICDNLDLKMYELQKTEVEKMSNNYHLGHTLMGAIPSSILSLFVGPWSDRYSRRIPMILGLVGFLLDDTISVVWACFPRARIEWYYFASLSSGCLGGFVCAITVFYSYVSDITTASNRTFRYALMEASLGFAVPMGVFAGGLLFKYYGSVAVFITTLVLHSLDLLFLYFFLPETRGIGNTDTWREKLRVFISPTNFLEGFRATLKSRPHRGRLQLWMLFAVMAIGILVTFGSANISIIFTRHHYNWHNTKYSMVSSIFMVMTTVVMMISTPIFTKVFRFSDPMLGIIGTASNLGKLVCLSIAAKSGLYYLGNLIGLFSSVAGPVGRARMSKIIPKSDLGKVFSFLGTAEVLLPIIFNAAISQLFNATLGVIPDPTHAFFSVLTVISLIIFIWLYMLPKVNYEEMREEEDRRNSSGSVGDAEVSSHKSAMASPVEEKGQNIA